MRGTYLLHCQAPHPSGRIDPELGAVHGSLIGDMPIPCDPTGRVLRRRETKAPGCIVQYCQKCKLWSEFRPRWVCVLDSVA